jgi:hypothetical protein
LELATTPAATTAWFTKGAAMYDEGAGTYDAAADDDAKKKDSDNFTRLLWKSTKSVGFGMKGEKLYAWFCDTKAPAGTPTDASKKKLFLANVGGLCK